MTPGVMFPWYLAGLIRKGEGLFIGEVNGMLHPFSRSAGGANFTDRVANATNGVYNMAHSQSHQYGRYPIP